MKKVYVKVDYQILLGGVIRPVVIHWYDGRTWPLRRHFIYAPRVMTLKEYVTRY